MEVVGLFEAKTKLSELCRQVASDQKEIVITRRGEPFVRLVPLEKSNDGILDRIEAYRRDFAHIENDGDEEEFELPPRRIELNRHPNLFGAEEDSE